MKVNRENRDEVSIQMWNDKIGSQFKVNNYQRFFSKRGSNHRFRSPLESGSPAQGGGINDASRIDSH